MIYPIDSTRRIETQAPISVARGSNDLCYKDTMVSARRNGPILTAILNILTKVWDFVKYHVLFLFFDEAEDTRKKLKTELREFWDSFDAMALSDPEAGKQTIQSEFNKLDSELQKTIEEQIAAVFKEHSPRIEEKDLRKQVKAVLNETPFLKIGDDHYIIPLALAKAVQKISGY